VVVVVVVVVVIEGGGWRGAATQLSGAEAGGEQTQDDSSGSSAKWTRRASEGHANALAPFQCGTCECVERRAAGAWECRVVCGFECLRRRPKVGKQKIIFDTCRLQSNAEQSEQRAPCKATRAC
jgi:hypothetical protein